MAEENSLGNVPVALSPRDRFVEYLQSRGMRVTQQRLALVDQVFSHHEHFDADTLVARVAADRSGRRVSRATVYRALKLLEEAGLLRKVARPNGSEVYEHDYGYPQHDHLYCEKCEKLIEFHSDEVTRIREVDGTVVGHGKLGPVTRRIQDTFNRAVRGQLPQYRRWLSFVRQPVSAA